MRIESIGVRTNNFENLGEALQEIGDIMECLKNREFILSNLRIGLQAESEEWIVKKDTDYDGIESYLYVFCGEKEGEIRTAKVAYHMLTEVGIAVKEAWKRAEKNTFSDICVEHIMKLLLGISEEEANLFGTPMYVVTNKRAYRGASVILHDETLKKFRDKLQAEKIVIFPSSIHECIVIPYDESISIEQMSDMVRTINATDVEEEDVLSNKAYIVAV